MRPRTCTAVLVVALQVSTLAAQEEAKPVVKGPELDPKKKVWTYTVSSPYQQRADQVEVLLPDNFDKAKQYRVLYVLPVNPGPKGRWGDGLQVVRNLDAHNEHELLCVQMTFDASPWYGAHANNRKIRHEEYVRRVVVPLVESRYPTLGTAEGRLLLGFSKSGWGAFSLILRNPDFFGYAASWDAPLMIGWYPNWGIPQHFGTAENFEQYRISTLFEKQARHFKDRARLVLLGEQFFGNWGGPQFQKKHHTAWAHEAMASLGIKHAYRNDLNVPHRWDAKWVEPAIEDLMRLATNVEDSPEAGG